MTNTQWTNKIYKADVESIRNLAEISKKLQDGSLSIPGNLTVEGNLVTNDNSTTKGHSNTTEGIHYNKGDISLKVFENWLFILKIKMINIL